MVFFGMNHPKHFWMFKKLIEYFDTNGLAYKVFVSEKDILPELLKASNMEYIRLGENKKGILNKSIQMIWYTFTMVYYLLKYKPKVWMGQALPHFAFASYLSKSSKFYILEDTDHVSALHKLTVPFCNKIYTTEKFPLKFGKKQVPINTYYELFYLHPNNFQADESILRILRLTSDDKFALLRLVSWNAHHDKNESGIGLVFLTKLISLIEGYGMKVFISSEIELPENFKKYILNIDPIHIHSVLKFASIYIGEGATLAAEASLLGVPSVYINSLDTNYCRELSDRYDLMLNYRNTNGVLNAIPEILDSIEVLKMKDKLNVLFQDKIDPLPFFLKQIL